MLFLPLILKRATRRLALILILTLGVILSTGLLASAPVLIDTVIEFGLPRRLHTANTTDPLTANLRLTSFANLGETDYHTLDDSVRATLETRFGKHLKQIALVIGSHWFHPWVEGTLLASERVNLRYIEDLETQTELISGSWPSSEIRNSEHEISGVISEDMAAYYELQPGSELPLSFDSHAKASNVILVVTGIIRPRHASDPFWMGVYNPLKSQGNARYTEQFGIFLPAETFFAANATLFPRSRSELAWHVIFDPDTITTSTLPAVVNRLTALPNDFPKTIAFESGLRDLLLDFYAQTQGIRVPIFLLTAEIVLLALAYVVMTAAQHVRTIEGEFALLRSRGASSGQILRIQLAEATLIAFVAWLAGPGLGAQWVGLLERFGPLADLSEGSAVLSVGQAAWLAAAVGAGACVVSLLLPVFPALRRSIVMHVQASGRVQKPLWQRLYLDVALLALGLILLFRLQLVGGVSGGSGGRVDWLLLLSPITLLLGAATLIIRLAPPVLGVLSRAMALGRGLPAPLALWQAARNPNQFAGVVLLLTLANALGILAIGLNTTLDASEFERARYAAGGEIRLAGESSPRAGRDNPLRASDFRTAPVENASAVVRMDGQVDLKSFRSFPGFDMLAIDPVSFSHVTVYRSDFSAQPMGDLLGSLLTKDAVPGMELPGQPVEIGLWIWALPDAESVIPIFLDGNSHRERVGYFVKVVTHSGEAYLLPLTDTDPNCVSQGSAILPIVCAVRPWAYMSASLPELNDDDYPLTLHSLWLRNRARSGGSFQAGASLIIGLDDISVKDRSGEVTVVEAFEDTVQMLAHELRYPQSDLSIFTYTTEQKHDGAGSGKLILNFTRMLEYQGLIFNIADRDDVPLPALVSPRFLAATNLVAGDLVNGVVQGQTILFEIKGVVDYFPTLYEAQEAGFLITSRSALLTRLGNETPFVFNPNEIWLDVAPGTDLEALATQNATQIWDADALRQVMKADPLALGLRSVTFLGYLLTTLISIIGFAAHFTLSVRQRETSFGILRAMGLSPWQLYGSLALEQAMIILTGLTLGALLGTVLNQIVLPGLPITLANQPPIPPFIPRTDWRPILQVFATLSVIFTLTFAGATWMLWRAKVHQALRIGQE
ncbi:MAG TPA: FtsX-like permease family protein [Anaerolineales bacterium]|nr:FtsX-like permease family protein [Anaerolineales bacterium]